MALCELVYVSRSVSSLILGSNILLHRFEKNRTIADGEVFNGKTYYFGWKNYKAKPVIIVD